MEGSRAAIVVWYMKRDWSRVVYVDENVKESREPGVYMITMRRARGRVKGGAWTFIYRAEPGGSLFLVVFSGRTEDKNR